MSKPLAFIDVDGVLNRIISVGEKPRDGLFEHFARPYETSREYRLWLDRNDADMLHSLEPDFELAWGTTWGNANDTVGTAIGLRPLELAAVAKMSDYAKAPGILRVADGRPFVWFEDLEGQNSLEFYASRMGYTQQFKVIKINPYIGLEAKHIEEARNWYDQL